MAEIKKISLGIPVGLYNLLVQDVENYSYPYVQELILAILREYYYSSTRNYATSQVTSKKKKSKAGRPKKTRFESIINKDVFRLAE